MSLVLASTSPTRRLLLANAGLTFEVRAPMVDEPTSRDSYLASGGTLDGVARHLAVEKALDVARRVGDRLVIGADQTLVADDRLFEKPGDRKGVIETLHHLNGRSHTLSSGVAIALGGTVLWTETSTARLTMRRMTTDEIVEYADRVGDDVFGSVGAYRIEGYGMTLFDAIEGEHTTILGLPMLPLLAALRRLEGVEP